MSINRIQKLLFSEYSDFEDMVLVESPFAQTTRDGIGVRQVQLGLTPSKLVLATDKIPLATNCSVRYVPGIDPDVETFELIAVYPIECVNLSVYHRKKRRALKAHFCNNRVMYFELGGFETRNMFWNLWCEKVKFLSPEDSGSSYSETSVASSTTNSTLYLISSRNKCAGDGVKQLWCRYGAGGDNPGENDIAKWTDKYLYMGNQGAQEKCNEYVPVCEMITDPVYLKTRKPNKKRNRNTIAASQTDVVIGNVYQINRFSSGVSENCSNGLFLPAEKSLAVKKLSHTNTESIASIMIKNPKSKPYINYIQLTEDCVKLWEEQGTMSTRSRSKRRYSLAPQSHFLRGFGPWNVAMGDRFSIQRKRAVSLVTIRRQPLEPELRLSVSKRQLIASISCNELLMTECQIYMNSNTIKCPPKNPVIFFWTPDYWYRPRAARDVYRELQAHLSKIRDRIQKKSGLKKRLSRKMKKRKRDDASEKLRNDRVVKLKQNGAKMLRMEIAAPRRQKPKTETSLQFLKRALKLDVAVSAWDFDSATLAYQLTIIDRDLFLKIPISEFGVLMWQQSARNAPNISALIAFSHRISCLVASEILKQANFKVRARLVTRFINMAEKCNRIANFQSCRSVLSGLQSPPIYRLDSIWSYVKKKHSSKYEVFQNLCHLHRDPRLAHYQHKFSLATQNSPHMPYIGDVIYRLLGHIPDYSRHTTKLVPAESKTIGIGGKDHPSFIRKLLSSLRMWHSQDVAIITSPSRAVEKQAGKSYRILDDYYQPMGRYVDDREECLRLTADLMGHYQRAVAHYMFSRNEMAQEYLLKARYKEDRDNWLLSLQVQPVQVGGIDKSKCKCT